MWQNKTIPFANVVHDDMPVSHDKYQAYYVLTQKVYDFVLGYMSRNEELETLRYVTVSVFWKGALGYILQYGLYIFQIEDNCVL